MNNTLTFSITKGEIVFHKLYDKVGMVSIFCIFSYWSLTRPVNIGGVILFGSLFIGCFLFGKFSDKFARQIIIDNNQIITFIMLRENTQYSVAISDLKYVKAAWFLSFPVNKKKIWFDRVYDKDLVSHLNEITQVKWTFSGKSRSKQGY